MTYQEAEYIAKGHDVKHKIEKTSEYYAMVFYIGVNGDNPIAFITIYNDQIKLYQQLPLELILAIATIFNSKKYEL